MSGSDCSTCMMVAWFARMKDLPNLFWLMCSPLEAKSPVIVLRPYVGPTWNIQYSYINMLITVHQTATHPCICMVLC